MAKSKHTKNHKKKALARKTQVQQDKNKMEKMKRDFIMNMIKKEQENGAFNNNPVVPSTPIVEGPII